MQSYNSIVVNDSKALLPLTLNGEEKTYINEDNIHTKLNTL
jgi:hypothetical protein